MSESMALSVATAALDLSIQDMLLRFQQTFPRLRRIACESVSMMEASGETNGFDEEVLAIDRRMERAFIDILRQEPTVGRVYSEDSGLIEVGAGPLTAVLDPVDGTKNYTMGLSYYAGSIAFVDEAGVCQAGVVTNLVTGKTYGAQRGRGATADGRRIGVRDERDLGAVNAIFVGLSHAQDELAVLGELAAHLNSFRAMGCSALDLCCLAEGRSGLTVDLSGTAKVVDFLAAALIVAEAGGSVSTDLGIPATDVLVGGHLAGSEQGHLGRRPRLVGVAGAGVMASVQPFVKGFFPDLGQDVAR